MTMAELPDPSPNISQMSQGQLRTLVEELVHSHNRNGDRLVHGQKEIRPSWWPPDVPWINPQIRTRRHSQQQVWSEGLRRVVRSCYKHHGQEHRLEEPADDSTRLDAEDLRVTTMIDGPSGGVNNNNESEYEAEMPALKSQLPDVVPTSGPIPSDSFSRWKSNIVANMAALPEAEADTGNKEFRDEKPFVEIFICFYCEKEFENRDHLQGHQESCGERVLVKPKKPKKIARRVAHPTWKCKPTNPDSYKRPDHKTFVEAMGLMPCSKLANFQKRKNKDKEEIKFEVIEIDDCPIPKTPPTPRSAKSLISQLSRDLSPPPSVSRLRRMTMENYEDPFDLLPGGIKLECKDVDEESSCSSKSDTVEAGYNLRKIPSLLAIDLCSVLGQRVKKHVDKLDSSERTPYEEFCHTPVKNNALDRLRNRPAGFPVTFRKTKRLCPSPCHWYKFTKEDRREFMSIVRTGLTRRARQLKRMMVPCRVVLDKMKEQDIIRWTTPKKHPQIRSMYAAYQQSWQYVTHQDGQRVLVNSAYPSATAMHWQQQDTHEFNQLMRMGQQLGLPMRGFSSGMVGPSPVGVPQPNRAYKAVLSGRPQPSQLMQHGNRQQLNVYQLPLSCPSNNRNFGKPLQPGGFYGPNPVRPQPLSSSNKSFHRPNILSKENGSLFRNRTVRRLSLDNPAKAGELTTTDHLQQLPSSVKQPEDDVISISSTDSESEMMTAQPPPTATLKRPLPEDRNNNNSANKRPRLSGGSVGGTQVVLFRCHLCQAEITCKIGQTDFIQKHFQDRHAVNNIHLLEHVDANNQKVVTIVEDSGSKGMPRPRPAHTQEFNRNPAGRLGPSSGQAMHDRAVLKDIHQHSAIGGPGLMRGRQRRFGRPGEQEGHTHRTNGVDSGPEEIIILD